MTKSEPSQLTPIPFCPTHAPARVQPCPSIETRKPDPSCAWPTTMTRPSGLAAHRTYRGAHGAFDCHRTAPFTMQVTSVFADGSPLTMIQTRPCGPAHTSHQ